LAKILCAGQHACQEAHECGEKDLHCDHRQLVGRDRPGPDRPEAGIGLAHAEPRWRAGHLQDPLGYVLCGRGPGAALRRPGWLSLYGTSKCSGQRARPAPTRHCPRGPRRRSRTAAGPSCRSPAAPTVRSRGPVPRAARTACDGRRYLPRQGERRGRQRRPIRRRDPWPRPSHDASRHGQVPSVHLWWRLPGAEAWVGPRPGHGCRGDHGHLARVSMRTSPFAAYTLMLTGLSNAMCTGT
jgi:hypothetical protein